MRFLLILLFIFIATSSPSVEARQAPKSGYEVIERMFEAYEGKWYEHLTFLQKTSFYGQDGKVQRVQDWYEALSLPSRLAIKFDEKNSNNGILFNSGIQYGYANGELIQETERINELLVLGFDIYHQDPKVTADQLTKLGYDLEKMYTDKWQGRKVYVIGVEKADTTKPQIWIDTERLYFVRNFNIGRANTIQEVQFNKYERLGQGWIAPEVIFKANGYIGLLEEYSQIVIPDSINSEVFNPVMFTETVWD